jgi:hypothetical protein
MKINIKWMKVRRRCGSPLGALKVFFFVFSLETQYCPRSAVRSGPACVSCCELGIFGLHEGVCPAVLHIDLCAFLLHGRRGRRFQRFILQLFFSFTWPWDWSFVFGWLSDWKTFAFSCVASNVKQWGSLFV